MNTSTFLFAFALATIPGLGNAQQHVWRVNNTSGNPYDADYTDLQNAIDMVPTGDTLHVEASTANYGLINLDHGLVIIGPGYFLDVNTGLQASAVDAEVAGLTFAAGSENSVVMGLYITSGSGMTVQAGNIVIRGNRLQYAITIPSGVPLNNILIQGNHLYGINCGLTAQVSNLNITNNMIGVGFTSYPNTTTGSFTYNVTGANSNFWGMTCANNIFRSGTTALNDNLFHHNYFHILHPAVPGTGNVLVDMGTVFAATPDATDGLYGLAPSSGALTASDVMGPIGVFGGSTPYRPSGIPTIPTIYLIQAPGTAVQGATINVTLSTRSNN